VIGHKLTFRGTTSVWVPISDTHTQFLKPSSEFCCNGQIRAVLLFDGLKFLRQTNRGTFHRTRWGGLQPL